MKVAVVITVKNEERLLRQNVLYHLGIGIDTVFVYFDNTTDRGKESIRDLEHVVCQDSVSQDHFKEYEYLELFTSNYQKIHTARQCLNTYDAQLKCRKKGIDWLISIDADELFLAGHEKRLELEEFFTPYNDFDVVQLQTLEVVSRKIAYNKVMLEESLFKLKKNFKNHFNKIYFKIYDPYKNTYFPHSFWLGHNMGKLAINVKSNTIPKNVHRYQSIDGSPLKKTKAGYVLHYHLYDYKDFVKKYENFKAHPDKFLSGNTIDSLKILWRNMVNDPKFDESYLKQYYKDNILVDKKKIRKLHGMRYFPFLKRTEKAVIHIDLPKEILQRHFSEN